MRDDLERGGGGLGLALCAWDAHEGRGQAYAMLMALDMIAPFLDAEIAPLKTEIEAQQRWGGGVIKTASEALTNHYDESVGSIEVLRGDSIEKYVGGPPLPCLPCAGDSVGVVV